MRINSPALPASQACGENERGDGHRNGAEHPSPGAGLAGVGEACVSLGSGSWDSRQGKPGLQSVLGLECTGPYRVEE